MQARSLPPPPLESPTPTAALSSRSWFGDKRIWHQHHRAGGRPSVGFSVLFFFEPLSCVFFFVFVSWYDRDRIVALLQPPGDPNWSKPTTPLKADPRNWILCNRNHFCLSGGSNKLKCCALQKKNTWCGFSSDVLDQHAFSVTVYLTVLLLRIEMQILLAALSRH
jgi:hypothetical protein